ncbi:CamS family sex pheromone protein [Jeotgalibaca caeni]|uniref:CamS family sex pheromone protein n=1 Tax=Jeotgalibaca caeni TaxID=3028623 RepID=UPI00237EA2C0|nr:CamS family sex pheromone protein [Jeotgalibaca caeni]MDE1547685.1 CamS family sex pheromone protein [Jeotgalibaca caeni]
MKWTKTGGKLGFVLASLLVLTACTDVEEQPETNTNMQTPNQSTVPAQATNNQLSNDYYRALIVDGKYQPSKNRGVSLSLNSSINMKDFESGLLEVAKGVFPTDQYFFQEGQYIDAETATSWLSRQSEENPNGLNPAGNGENDPSKRVPIYLDQILEQNFMVQTDAGYQLGGIAIGLAMNQIDYYSVKDENENFEFYEQDLDMAQVEERAKEYGNKVVSRLREISGLESIPITVGIFVQAPQDSLAGGVYRFEGLSQEGGEVAEWVPRNEKKVLFPTEEESEDASHFANFRNQVQNFFPNLSGITGIGHYRNDQLLSLKIDVMTQFYGETEMIAFTQHITDAATQYLPENVQIEINIKSINGTEAFLAREQGNQTFNFHIFD